ncbi:MAG: 50S ribosomal protein L18 [Clostridiales bacterium]|jgi:large subunit ribosomal protein L18|nr:50S ribosomal protein L18 [Clostridiales bacterium]
MIKKPARNVARKKRQLRIRNKVQGNMSKPRLSVFRSNKHMYAQIIDDVAGHTLASASTKEKDLATTLEKTSDIAAAKAVGERIGKKALAIGITKVVFDRSGYIYHGKVQALADAAREAGLEF